MAKDKKVQVLEMTNVELSKRVNELIEFTNGKKWGPLEMVMILNATQQHVMDAHGIEIQEINFERSGLQ